MSSQLVDINADGFNDILCGSFSGTPQIVMGSKDGFELPRDMLDGDGEQILIERFWNRADKKWDATDRCGSKGLCTSSSLVDWDNDGDLDLILGGYRNGQLFLRLNEGSATEPKFATSNTTIKSGKEDLKVPKGLAAPCVVDWNQDGLFDILCGGSKGGVYYFENKGSKESPEFADRQELISPTDKNGSFIGVVPANGDLPALPGTSWHIDPVDYDGDGDLDLLVGGRSSWERENAPKLSDEEQQELDEIRIKFQEARKKLTEFTAGKSQDEIKELRESEDYLEIIKEYSAVSRRQRTLSTKASPTQSGDFVWVFRRK